MALRVFVLMLWVSVPMFSGNLRVMFSSMASLILRPSNLPSCCNFSTSVMINSPVYLVTAGFAVSLYIQIVLDTGHIYVIIP